jgi:hypothetical protein
VLEAVRNVFGQSCVVVETACSEHVRGRRAVAKLCFSYTVAAREFGKHGTFGPSLAGLGLLRFGQFWFEAHALPVLLRPAVAVRGTAFASRRAGEVSDGEGKDAPAVRRSL